MQGSEWGLDWRGLWLVSLHRGVVQDGVKLIGRCKRRMRGVTSVDVT